MNTEGPNQTQTQKGAKQTQSQSGGTQREPQKPGEDADTLIDDDYLEAQDPHPDSRPDSRRDQTIDPERSGGAQDRSQSI